MDISVDTSGAKRKNMFEGSIFEEFYKKATEIEKYKKNFKKSCSEVASCPMPDCNWSGAACNTVRNHISRSHPEEFARLR